MLLNNLDFGAHAVPPEFADAGIRGATLGYFRET